MTRSLRTELWALIAQDERGRDFIRSRQWDELSLDPSLSWHVMSGNGSSAGDSVALAGPVFHERASSEGVSRVHASAATDRMLGLRCETLYDDPERVLRELRFPFAIACWDAKRQSLILARDHFGQEQVFLRRFPGLTVVCSALDPLLRLDECTLDGDSTAHYLMLGRPAPGHTLAREVTVLPAGHMRVFRTGEAPSTRRYFTPLSPEAPLDNSPELREALARRLNERLATDTQSAERVGVLLSGGLDSSYLAACLHAAPGRRAPLVNPIAYTVEFDEALGVNETHYARTVADQLGWEQRVVHVSVDQAVKHLDSALSAAEPCPAPAVLSNLALTEAALADGTQRLISGLGSDELFGTYTRMLHHYAAFVDRMREGKERSPSWLFRQSQLRADGAPVVLYSGVCQFLTNDLRRRAFSKDYASLDWSHPLQTFYTECLELKPEAHLFELMVAYESQHRIPEVLLPGLAGSARQAGLDMRFPFLDPEVARLITGLKASARTIPHADGLTITKLPLRELAQPLLPAEILERPRASFMAPFRHFMQQRSFAAPVTERLRESRFFDEGIVNRSWLNELLDELFTFGQGPHVHSPEQGQAPLQRGPLDAENNVWSLLTVCAWYDRYVASN